MAQPRYDKVHSGLSVLFLCSRFRGAHKEGRVMVVGGGGWWWVVVSMCV